MSQSVITVSTLRAEEFRPSSNVFVKVAGAVVGTGTNPDATWCVPDAPITLVKRSFAKPARFKVKSDAEVKIVFNYLAARWHSETGESSSIRDKISHPDYTAIIGLGAPAIPLILDELAVNPDFWFTALASLAYPENPVPKCEDFRGVFKSMVGLGAQEGVG